MRAVVWSRDALDDVASVVRYIAREKGVFALTVADRLDACATLLGTLATGRAGRVTGTYEKPVDGLPYTMAYAIEQCPDGSERVVVLRVIHQARHWAHDAWPAAD